MKKETEWQARFVVACEKLARSIDRLAKAHERVAEQNERAVNIADDTFQILRKRS